MLISKKQVRDTFSSEFMTVFGTIEGDTLKYDKNRIFDLLMWLLLKTRYDFLIELDSAVNTEELKRDYLENWAFFFSVLKSGIYK